MAERGPFQVIAEMRVDGKNHQINIPLNGSLNCDIPPSSLSLARNEDGKLIIAEVAKKIVVQGRDVWSVPGSVSWLQTDKGKNEVVLTSNNQRLFVQKVGELFKPVEVYIRAPQGTCTNCPAQIKVIPSPR